MTVFALSPPSSSDFGPLEAPVNMFALSSRFVSADSRLDGNLSIPSTLTEALNWGVTSTRNWHLPYPITRADLATIIKKSLCLPTLPLGVPIKFSFNKRV